MDTLRAVFLLLTLFMGEIINATTATDYQTLPCLLFIREIDYAGGVHGSRWECQVYGEDAQSAGAAQVSQHAMVTIEGIDLVLEANPSAQSGVTTLFASGALLADFTLTITADNELTFGETPSFSSATGRRQLSNKSGPLDVLAVRITTNDAALTKTAAQVSDKVFGTNGDVVNFKSMAEKCSDRAVTIIPASHDPDRVGTACVNNPGFFSAGLHPNSGLQKNCVWFEQFFEFDSCSFYGEDEDVEDGGPPETANSACCVCGGGTTVDYETPIVDGVIDLHINVTSNGLNNDHLEKITEDALEAIFNTANLSTVFDNVMLFMPNGTYMPPNRTATDWIAWGYVGGYLSAYNGEAGVTTANVHMHEIGHNWGLDHASEIVGGRDIEYGDRTGVMGSSSGPKDEEIADHKYCFNGAHSWQLGWYDLYNDKIDPLTETYVGKLAGVGKLPNLNLCSEIIVLKLENTRKDLYIIYNHALGANAGTAETPDEVTITSKTTGARARTYLESTLEANQYTEYTIAGGPNLIIWVPSIDTSEDGFAEIVVYRGTIGDRHDHYIPRDPDCRGPTSGPTAAPTGGPTAVPTGGPTSTSTSGPTVPTSAPTSGPTSALEPTSGPTSAPTSSPTSGPTLSDPIFVPPMEPNEFVPTAGPTSMPTSGPTSGPTSSPTKQSEINGDPHFKTWKKDHFEFHGQCDIVMISNKNFANGLGIDIHIRTKIVRYWSYIQRAVIRIGNDILEVEGLSDFSASYWINYEHMGELTDLDGFPISLNENTDRYTIDLDSVYPGEKIQIKTFKEFVGVKIVGSSEASFGKSVGIIGDFRTGKTYARDGSTVLNDFTDLGLEWQVVPSDGHYFHEAARPQFPELCYLPEDPHGARARRLDESSITEEEAEAACASLQNEFSRKGCVYDVLATQDLDMARAY